LTSLREVLLVGLEGLTRATCRGHQLSAKFRGSGLTRTGIDFAIARTEPSMIFSQASTVLTPLLCGTSIPNRLLILSAGTMPGFSVIPTVRCP
jgi:hypothetical protein